MKCEMCEKEMVIKRATKENSFHYTMSGLKNVFLVGISYYECPTCHEKVPDIPRMGELHRVIAKALIAKETTLSGDEVRYLRKNAGFTGSDFAALIGVSAEHLSRVENSSKESSSHGDKDDDKTVCLGPTADKMVRIVAAYESGGEQFRDVLLDKVRKIKKRRGLGRQVFKLGGDRWSPDKAA